jgi:hypothetical protein
VNVHSRHFHHFVAIEIEAREDDIVLVARILEVTIQEYVGGTRDAGNIGGVDEAVSTERLRVFHQ